MIAARQAEPEPRDILGMLVHATDREEAQLDDRAIRDETVGLIYAGHTTTANTLTFALAELGAQPGDHAGAARAGGRGGRRADADDGGARRADPARARGDRGDDAALPGRRRDRPPRARPTSSSATTSSPPAPGSSSARGCRSTTSATGPTPSASTRAASPPSGGARSRRTRTSRSATGRRSASATTCR